MRISKYDLCEQCRGIRPRLSGASGEVRGDPIETLLDGRGYEMPMAVGMINQAILQYLVDDGGCRLCIALMGRITGTVPTLPEEPREPEETHEQRLLREKWEREKIYTRLLNEEKTAQTEDEFRKLAVGFESLASHQEYIDKNVGVLALKYEKKYLNEQFHRLEREKRDAKTEDEFKKLVSEFESLASNPAWVNSDAGILAFECEEKYLCEKFHRLESEKRDAEKKKDIECLLDLSEKFEKTAEEINSLIGKMQQVIEKSISTLTELAKKCEKAAKDCVNERNRIVRDNERQRIRRKRILSIKFSVGLLLSMAAMLAYYNFLWNTDTFGMLIMYLAWGVDISGQYLALSFFPLRMPLLEGAWMQIIQMGVPLGIHALLIGVIVRIFLRKPRLRVGSWLIVFMIVSTIISFALWMVNSTYGSLSSIPVDMLLLDVLLPLTLVVVPVIPGLIVASIIASIIVAILKAAGKISNEKQEEIPHKWVTGLKICIILLAIAVSAYGVYDIW